MTPITIHTLHSIPQKHIALETLSQINRLERKTFPASEAFDFSDQSLWRKKPNTRILYAIVTSTNATSNTKAPAHNPIIAYALYVRQGSTALLHKICVAEPFRNRGIGRQLLVYVIEKRLRGAEKGCLAVQLWVDEKREAARRLYKGCGFMEVEGVEDYYGPGRRGVKMVLRLEGQGEG
ncbi:acetyltransferase [Paracoccidioides lutzii Pb01]|uniref:Acetyltransferase n=1 Tax=Paracoccidioides lutzii (strain ATCC MYA-826 / Pb01) TaxID=502779 RepID=C1GPC4_PARBA|nr:acetyltransferase [Paracoccidioides lutzii Pb01]EEH36046.1 acetyltransferase [Paracoccidioides lutzii Pb01]